MSSTDEIHAIIARNKQILELLHHHMHLLANMEQATDAYFTAAIAADHPHLNNTKEEMVLDATSAAIIDACPNFGDMNSTQGTVHLLICPEFLLWLI